MTAIIIPSRRLVQPRGRIQADNDVIRRLNITALLEPTQRSNLATLSPNLVGTGRGVEGTATTRIGAAFAVDASAGVSGSISWQTYRELTMFWYGMSQNLSSTYTNVIGGIHTVSGTPQWQGFVNSNSGVGNYIFNFYWTPTFVGSSTVTHIATSSANVPIMMIGTFKVGDAIRIYTNGFVRASAAVPTTSGATTILGATIEGTFNLNVTRSYAICYAGFASRAWTENEALEIGQNPWIFFRPANSSVFYSLPPLGTTLSNPTVFNITGNSANPRVTITF